MTWTKWHIRRTSVSLFAGLLFLADIAGIAQNSPDKDEFVSIGEAQRMNQAKLSRYTWQETQIISVSKEAVDYRLYSVKVGPKGQFQRDLVTESIGQQAIFKPKKKEQLSPEGPYGEQLLDLADQYTTLDGERLTQAGNRGDVTSLNQGELTDLAIKNYLKPGDVADFTIDRRSHRLVSVRAKSYLSHPEDPITIKAEFTVSPDGTNHLSTVEVDNERKHLSMKLTNWSYQ
jgi:hypothetical protein